MHPGEGPLRGGQAEPVEFLGADDVGEGHRRLDGHPVGQWRVGGRGVQVIVPAAVLDLTCDKLVRSRSLVDVVWGLAQVVEERAG